MVNWKTKKTYVIQQLITNWRKQIHQRRYSKPFSLKLENEYWSNTTQDRLKRN